MFEQISSGSFMAQDADEAGPIAVEEQFFEQDIEKKSPTGFLPRLPRG